MNSPSDPEKSIRPLWFRIFYDLTHTSGLSRFLFFFLGDVLIAALSLYLSFFVHFNFSSQIIYAELVQEVLLFFVVVRLCFFVIFRIYKITWRYVGLPEEHSEAAPDRSGGVGCDRHAGNVAGCPGYV